MTTSNDAKTQQSLSRKEKTNPLDDSKPAEPAGPVIDKHKPTHKVYGLAKALLALIIIACVIFALSSTLQLRQNMANHERTLLSQMSRLKEQLKISDHELTHSINTIKQSQDTIEAKVNFIDKTLQSSLKQRQYQSNDWLLLKARYYLELAQINAHWCDNIQITTTLLQQADALMANIHDHHLFVIRQAIAKEIAQLQAIPKLDTTGLLSQFDGIQTVVANLPIHQTNNNSESDKPVADEANKGSAWRDNFKSSLKLLEKLIVIRHQDTEIKSLPSPEYETMLRESIYINLQEAQWAIIQLNDAVYQFALTQAINTINRTFQPNAAGTQALIKQLQRLQVIHLVQKKPVLDKSLSLLNQLIDSKNVQTVEPSSSPKGENP